MKILVEALFNALSECAALHPDPESMEQDDEGHTGMFGGDNQWFTADNINNEDPDVADMTRAALEHLETVFDMPPRSAFSNLLGNVGLNTGDDVDVEKGRFDDADASCSEQDPNGDFVDGKADTGVEKADR